ncbi:MAG: M15 family metallopeptidase, partial [Rubellimicrobium sp.]|nr:M15 family metallopeptidase [Rubellimicrobium sp.]
HTKRQTGRDWIIDRIPGPDHDPAEAQRRFPQQAAPTMRAFYGDAGGSDAIAGIVRLPFPFRLAWKLDQQIGTFRCHRRLAEPLTAIFAETARHYGRAEMERLRLHIWGGCFNHRPMRGGTALSTHAWGAAVDLDPARNQLPWGRDRAAFAHPDYDAFWTIVESHGAVSLGRAANRDWMHFQFARL